MKRLMAGASALGLAGLALVGLASPGSAGAPPGPEFVQLEAAVTPASPEVGDSVTISSVDPCSVADSEVYVYIYSDTTGQEEEGIIPAEADGSWELSFEADIAEDLYFYGECLPPGWEERYEECFDFGPQAAAATLTEGPEETVPPTTAPEVPDLDCTFEYYELEFSVGDPPPSTTVPGGPTGPSPAPPIAKEPSFTG